VLTRGSGGSGSVIPDSAASELGALEQPALRVLRESDRVKDEFLAILGHELRNRLAPIRSAVETLLANGSLTPEIEPAVDLIDRQSIQMVRLVEDLLDVSRIARNELPLHTKRVKLQNVLREAFEVSRPLIDQREQTLSVSLAERAIYLEADRVRLSQAITNLLNNAALHTAHGGRIWLSSKRQSDYAVVTVSDDGTGIPRELLPRIFEMFVRAESPDESQHGLGVGLTLVKRIVELHGGTIEARSDGPGTGSEFVVRLPVVTRRARPRESGSCERTQRILVVDDDRDLAESLALALTSRGHIVRSAHDGDEAIELAEAFQPEVAVLDVSLPTISGPDVVHRLRQRSWSARTVWIATSGWSDDQTRDRALAAGFDHYLVKPVGTDALAALFAKKTA
jgi:CheY-like chemotaxis protein/two-component sensor histidine kinase